VDKSTNTISWDSEHCRIFAACFSEVHKQKSTKTCWLWRSPKQHQQAHYKTKQAKVKSAHRQTKWGTLSMEFPEVQDQLPIPSNFRSSIQITWKLTRINWSGSLKKITNGVCAW